MGQGEVQEQQRCGAGRGCRSKRGDVGQPPCTGGPGQHPQEGPLSHAQLQPPSGICGTLGTGTCGPPGPQRHANPPQAAPTPVTHLHPERSRHAGGSRVATSLVPVLGAASKWEQQQEGKGEDEVGGVSRGQQGGVKWGSNQGTLTPFLTVTLPKSQASPKGCGGGSPQVGGDR